MGLVLVLHGLLVRQLLLAGEAALPHPQATARHSVTPPLLPRFALSPRPSHLAPRTSRSPTLVGMLPYVQLLSMAAYSFMLMLFVLTLKAISRPSPPAPPAPPLPPLSSLPPALHCRCRPAAAIPPPLSRRAGRLLQVPGRPARLDDGCHRRHRRASQLVYAKHLQRQQTPRPAHPPRARARSSDTRPPRRPAPRPQASSGSSTPSASSSATTRWPTFAARCSREYREHRTAATPRTAPSPCLTVRHQPPPPLPA